MQFANRTHLNLELGGSKPVSIAATGVVYNTPLGAQEVLKDLSRLQYLKGELKFKVAGDSALSAAALKLTLKAGGVAIGETTVTGSGDEEMHGRFVCDLSGVNGMQAIELEVEVVAAQAASVNIFSMLDIEHPLVISA
tara:strand:+ start:8833 stop:9246 length:414 start_codon:yes stop_codon:yes gene_type:complete